MSLGRHLISIQDKLLQQNSENFCSLPLQKFAKRGDQRMDIEISTQLLLMMELILLVMKVH